MKQNSRLAFSFRALAFFFAIAISSFAVEAPSVFKRITIDGSFADWAGVPPAYEDAADSTDSADYKTVYVAHDENFIYIRFSMHAPREQFTSHENIFVDADNDPSTGYALFVGSEMLIQGGSGYEERTGIFNAGGINGLGWAAAPSGVASEYEVRISRNATKASDGARVFNSDTIAFILEAEDANWARKDTAPDIEGISYTLTPPPGPLGNPVDLIAMGSSTWKYLTPSSAPAEDWETANFDDSAWASGQSAFGYPVEGAPTTIRTPFPTGTSVAYLRTRFNWDHDTTGVVLAATARSIDGAVYYLNGQEVRRIGMPDGPISFNTAATGGHPGLVTIFGIDPGALIVGENVFAVELHDQIQGALNLYFDMGLQATTNYPVIFTDSAQPADRSVVAGQSTTFTVEVLGSGPLTYQWLKAGQPIEGATNSTYTIGTPLSADAGAYSVRVTNPGATITSRAAQFTVTGAPVAITDPALPANVTTVEGLSASFTVQATGSAPVTYQWYKGANPIGGATGNTYSIPVVARTDAGDYSVRVTNPVNTVTSRVASLIVAQDISGPQVTSISGSANKVIVQFNEPVSAVAASNFQISGGATVQNAALDPADASRVVLTTTGVTLGSQFTLTITGVTDRFGNTITQAPQTFRSAIIIDGSFADWAGLEIAHTDDQESPAAGTDFKYIWATSDEDYIYIRFTLYAEGNPNTFLNNIFVDADNDSTTGYTVAGIGSEMLIQQGAGYQQKNRGFNEGAIDDLGFQVSPEGSGTEFELRISRHAKFHSDGLPVFTADSIKFVLETENPSFATTDLAPNTGGLELVLAQRPLGPLVVGKQGSNVVISWVGPGQLQTRASLTEGDWADVLDLSNPYTVTNPSGQAFFRLRSAP